MKTSAKHRRLVARIEVATASPEIVRELRHGAQETDETRAFLAADRAGRRAAHRAARASDDALVVAVRRAKRLNLKYLPCVQTWHRPRGTTPALPTLATGSGGESRSAEPQRGATTPTPRVVRRSPNGALSPVRPPSPASQ